MQALAFLFFGLFVVSCSSPNYKTWSRQLNSEMHYLMYARPRTTFDTSSQKKAGEFFHSVNLVNQDGRVVHQWNAGCPVAHAELFKDFQLAVACYIFFPERNYLPPGSFEKIHLIDRHSNLLQEYLNVKMHHTFFKKENNFLVFQSRIVRPSELKKLGITPINTKPWTDEVLEIDKSGRIVWSWDTITDGAITSANVSKTLFKSDLTHGNSLNFYQHSKLSMNPVVVLSFRNISTVLIVDYVTKKIIWSSPAGMLSMQHDATLIDDRTLLVFDNDVISNNSKSKIIKFDLITNVRTIIYEQDYFAVAKMGAVQNTGIDRYLITDSSLGYAFEVDSRKNLLSYIWNANLTPNKSIKNLETDAEANIFIPIFKVKKYNLRNLPD